MFIPAGTEFLIELDSPINDSVLDAPHDLTMGIPVKAHTVDELRCYGGDAVCFPAHSEIFGRAQKLGDTKRAYLLQFDQLVQPDGRKFAIVGQPTSKNAQVEITRSGKVFTLDEFWPASDSLARLVYSGGRAAALRRSQQKDSSYDLQVGDRFLVRLALDISSARTYVASSAIPVDPAPRLQTDWQHFPDRYVERLANDVFDEWSSYNFGNRMARPVDISSVEWAFRLAPSLEVQTVKITKSSGKWRNDKVAEAFFRTCLNNAIAKYRARLSQHHEAEFACTDPLIVSRFGVFRRHGRHKWQVWPMPAGTISDSI